MMEINFDVTTTQVMRFHRTKKNKENSSVERNENTKQFGIQYSG